jgi:RNA polymerase sigma-70 factor (ECF subfamily)
MVSADESILLDRAAAGETEAFRILFETHHEAIFRVAFRLTNQREAAEDITQDCFLRLVSRRGGFDPPRGSLRQFLHGMARNLVSRYWTARVTDVSLNDEDADDPPADDLPPVDAIIFREIADAVQAALATLPILQREAIVLFEFEDLSLEEVAVTVGADVGTVKSRLHRARKRLRLALGPYWESRTSPRKGVSCEIAK